MSRSASSSGRSRHVIRRGALLTTWLLVAVACGGDDDGSGAAEFVDLLGQVPAEAISTDAEGTPLLHYVDMGLVWERLGVDDPREERSELPLGQLSEQGTFSFTPQLFGQQAARFDEAEAEVGFSMLDVQREIAVDLPPSELRIVETTTERDGIVDALESDPTWSDRLDVVESDAGDYFTWTDDEELATDPERTTPMRPLGTGGQLAVEDADDGSTVVRTKTSSLMEDVLTTVDGGGESLADVSPFSDVTGKLSPDRDLIQAAAWMGSTPVADALGGRMPQEQIDQLLEEAVLVDPYQAIVLVELIDDDEEVQTELFVVYDSEELADTNGDRIGDLVLDGSLPSSGQPVNGIFPGAEVDVWGSTVHITTHGAGHFAGPYRALMQRDLFLVE